MTEELKTETGREAHGDSKHHDSTGAQAGLLRQRFGRRWPQLLVHLGQSMRLRF